MNKARYHTQVPSPVGVLTLTSDGDALTGLYMENQKHRPELPAHSVRDDSRFTAVREQLAAYFAGELQRFDVRLDAAGTAFQQQVWQALMAIPFGATETYGGLAARLANPRHHARWVWPTVVIPLVSSYPAIACSVPAARSPATVAVWNASNGCWRTNALSPTDSTQPTPPRAHS